MAANRIKIVGAPYSTCTRKLMCALTEKGIPWDFEFVDIFKGEHKKPEYLAKHPWGQIPYIEDGDFRLFESRAVLRYLAEKYKDVGISLVPADLKAKALMEQQLSVETSNATPHIMKLVYQLTFNPMMGKPTDDAVVEAETKEVARAFDIYEQFLSEHKYIGGETYSLADISNAPYFQYLSETTKKHLIDERPHLAAWWKSVSERPAWQTAIGKAPAPK